jgi:hypothetical protein
MNDDALTDGKLKIRIRQWLNSQFSSEKTAPAHGALLFRMRIEN